MWSMTSSLVTVRGSSALSTRVAAFAVQLAAALGAYVSATARPGADEAYLRDLGAHHTVDFIGDVPAAAVAYRECSHVTDTPAGALVRRMVIRHDHERDP